MRPEYVAVSIVVFLVVLLAAILLMGKTIPILSSIIEIVLKSVGFGG